MCIFCSWNACREIVYDDIIIACVRKCAGYDDTEMQFSQDIILRFLFFYGSNEIPAEDVK